MMKSTDGAVLARCTGAYRRCGLLLLLLVVVGALVAGRCRGVVGRRRSRVGRVLGGGEQQASLLARSHRPLGPRHDLHLVAVFCTQENPPARNIYAPGPTVYADDVNVCRSVVVSKWATPTTTDGRVLVSLESLPHVAHWLALSYNKLTGCRKISELS